MGVALGRFQLLRKFGLLLAEILSGLITRGQITLKLGLRLSQFVDLRGLARKLVPQIRYRLVTLSDLGAGDLAVMACIAQLLFKRGSS